MKHTTLAIIAFMCGMLIGAAKFSVTQPLHIIVCLMFALIIIFLAYSLSLPPKLSTSKYNIDRHQKLDKTVSEWILETRGKPSKSTILELLSWSYNQTERSIK